MLIVIHRRGGCGKPALLVPHPVEPGDLLVGLQHLDGRPFVEDAGTGETGELIVCDSCGGEIAELDFYYAEPLEPK